MRTQLALSLAAWSLAASFSARAANLAGPITNAANGHIYYLLTANTWTASEAEARALGGHLVTISDFAENQWIVEKIFPLTGVPYASLWIGFNDAANEGQFVWASGEPVTFTYWYPGEPNNLGGEDYTAIRHPSEVPPTGSWNDLSDTSGLDNPNAPVFGVVEVYPSLPPSVVLAGPITNPANGHTYYLLTANTWTASEAKAKALGGHLVTINDAAENQWVADTFFPLTGVPYASLWIGLNDVATEGQFVWASGESVTFTYWYPGEPNDAGGAEDYATIRHPSEAPPTVSWNDLWDTFGVVNPNFPVFGVVEISESLPPPPPPVTLRIHSAIELEFTTVAGQCYQVQSSPDLVIWTPLGGPVSGNGASHNLLVSTKNTAGRFYRLALTGETATGLVASYRFDGSPADCSTNGNHGIAHNVMLATNRFGKANAAYQFAGTSDSYISVPHSPTLDITNAITLAAWINFEVGGTVFPRIINKKNYELATGEFFRTSRQLHFSISNPTQTILSTPTDILQAGRWHFVVATYDGSRLLEYVDGTLLATTVAPGGLMSTSLNLNIGRNSENGSDSFKGLIDDVRIYNRALSVAEITALFNEAE